MHSQVFLRRGVLGVVTTAALAALLPGAGAGGRAEGSSRPADVIGDARLCGVSCNRSRARTAIVTPSN
jgi:hypothetical protein